MLILFSIMHLSFLNLEYSIIEAVVAQGGARLIIIDSYFYSFALVQRKKPGVEFRHSTHKIIIIITPYSNNYCFLFSTVSS